MDQVDGSVSEQVERAFAAGGPRLRRIAYRVLDSWEDADEVLQSAWHKIGRAPADEIRDADAWLTALVTRAAIDHLRARQRRTRYEHEAASQSPVVTASDPEAAAVRNDAIGVALLVVLDRLGPLERVAFVLHDMFGAPFDEVARLIDRSPEATRQLASRARRRVRGADEAAGAGGERHRALAERFVAAARTGDLAALLQLLHPQVTLGGDDAALRMAPGAPLVGAEQVATFFAGRAAGAHVAIVDGRVGLLVIVDDAVRLAVSFGFAGDRIAQVHAIADPAALTRLEVRIPA